MESKRKFKLDIFDVLKRLSQKNHEYTDEELKAMAPLVIMRWLSGTADERQIILLNYSINRYCFSLQKHKQLLINLMTITTSGKYSRYTWIKNEATIKKLTISTQVVSEYYNYSHSNAKASVNLLSDSAIINCAIELGYQPDKMKLLQKELKLR